MNKAIDTRITVVGFGSWGTALTVLLANKGYDVKVTARNIDHIAEVEYLRSNIRYLPQVRIPDSVKFENKLNTAVEDADIVLFAVPAQHFANTLKKAAGSISEDAIIVNVAKGIDMNSLKRLSELSAEIAPKNSYVALSGPSHAEEVGLNMPAGVVAASKDKDAALKIQEVFMNDRFRVYTHDDIIGVELGGALKNIMAIGAGISDGLGYGDSAKAAMMTRGIAEIARLGMSLGAKQETFAGLSGIGDLIVTCTSNHSRNRRCGLLIGQGMSPKEAAESIGMVVEGTSTCEAAYKLAKSLGVDMPITEMIHACLNGEINAKEAIDVLMTRSPKDERK